MEFSLVWWVTLCLNFIYLDLYLIVVHVIQIDSDSPIKAELNIKEEKKKEEEKSGLQFKVFG